MKRSRDRQYFGGLDLSYTGTGFVILDNEGRLAHSILVGTPSELVDDPLRQGIIARKVKAVANVYRPVIVAIEGYAFAGPRLVRLAELGGVVKFLLWGVDIDYYPIAPSTLKKWATGNGRADKDEMVKTARDLWPECPDDNSADAFLLAVKGREDYLAGKCVQ
jgi:crossover junction endodeoxyribonuclease RuvC